MHTDDGDFIFYNSETYGKPMIIKRADGIWGTPRPMIPVDIVDNYSYLRIGWVTYEDGVFYATGELGRRGSTGTHAQEMAVVLRSIDGFKWTMDRYRYIGAVPLRSPLLMSAGYAYLVGDAVIDRAPLTPVFGLDDGDVDANHVYIEIEDEILSWNRNEPNHGESGTLQMQLSDPERTLSDQLSAGYMLKLYAGYKDTAGDNEVLMGTYGLDSIPRGTAAPSLGLSLNLREWAYRNLKDNTFDQDWQWLSQTKHYDDCDNIDGLYSLGGGYLRLEGDSGTTAVDIDDVTLEDGQVKIITTGRRTVLVSTQPFEADDALAVLGFTIPAAIGAYEGLKTVGLGYSLSDERLGCGAGAALINDQYNFITAFFDVVTEHLVLLSVTGSEVSESWDEVEDNDLSAKFTDGDYCRVWLDVVGTHVRYGYDRYVSGSAGIQASEEYSTTVTRNDENRTGVVAASSYPSMKSILTDLSKYRIQPQITRHLSEFNDGAEIAGASSYAETSDYTWEQYDDMGWLDVDGEIMDLVDNGIRGDFCTGKWEIISATNPSGIGLSITVDKSMFPPGGAWGFWTTDGVGYIVHFVDGVLSGEIGWINVDAVESGVNLVFPVLVNYNYGSGSMSVPDAGDHIVIGPAFGAARVISAAENHLEGVLAKPAAYKDFGVELLSFCAYDYARDMSIDWLLKDVAAKAGILDIVGSVVSDDTETSISEDIDAFPGWLAASAGDFLLNIALPGSLTGKEVTLYFGCATKSVTPASGCKVVITNAAGETTTSFYHTADTNWTKFFELTDTMVGGENIRLSKCGRSVSVWLEDRLLGSCSYFGFTGLAADNYSSAIEGVGYIGIDSDIVGDHEFRQSELYAIADGIIADQGMPAITVMQRVIRDARIKVLSSSSGGLRISSFEDRDDLGIAPDVIFEDATNNNDRIPSHIRAVGAEISEYIDHAIAAEFGILFHTIRVESLDEEGAYTEAVRTAKDAISYSEGSRPRMAAQLQYEVEDKIAVDFTSFDGEVVDRACVVDALRSGYSQSTLEIVAQLRRLYD